MSVALLPCAGLSHDSHDEAAIGEGKQAGGDHGVESIIEEEGSDHGVVLIIEEEDSDADTQHTDGAKNAVKDGTLLVPEPVPSNEEDGVRNDDDGKHKVDHNDDFHKPNTANSAPDEEVSNTTTTIITRDKLQELLNSHSIIPHD